jgi:hypothetical protein
MLLVGTGGFCMWLDRMDIFVNMCRLIIGLSSMSRDWRTVVGVLRTIMPIIWVNPTIQHMHMLHHARKRKRFGAICALLLHMGWFERGKKKWLVMPTWFYAHKKIMVSPNWNTFEQVQKQTNDMCVSSSYSIKKL